jgi:hypothetical protein
LEMYRGLTRLMSEDFVYKAFDWALTYSSSPRSVALSALWSRLDASHRGSARDLLIKDVLNDSGLYAFSKWDTLIEGNCDNEATLVVLRTEIIERLYAAKTEDRSRVLWLLSTRTSSEKTWSKSSLLSVAESALEICLRWNWL